jgi:hypothetical protein
MAKHRRTIIRGRPFVRLTHIHSKHTTTVTKSLAYFNLF